MPCATGAVCIERDFETDKQRVEYFVTLYKFYYNRVKI